MTTITVDSLTFELIHEDRGKFLLIDRKPLEEHGGIQLFSGEGIFYRGILVKKAPTAFAYNFLAGIDLTEDRTIANNWEVEYRIADFLVNGAPKRLKRALSLEFLEHTFSYPSFTSDEAKEILLALSDKDLVPARMQGYVNTLRKTDGSYPVRPATPREQKMLERAFKVLDGIGLEVNPHTVNISDKLPPGVMGCANSQKIYIAGATFVEGDVELVGTLLEEHCHHALHYQDMSRRFQSYLVDFIAGLAIEKESKCAE